MQLIKKKNFYTLCFCIAIFLFLVCHIFDIYFYPQHRWSMFGIRIAISCAFIFGIFLLFISRDTHYDIIASSLAFLSGVAVTSSSVVTGDGFASPIYAGYFLIIMVYSLLFQIKTKYYIATLLAVLTQHFVVLSFIPTESKYIVLQAFALIPSVVVGAATHHIIYTLVVEYYQKQLFKNRVREQRKQQIILEKLVKEKTADLEEANEKLKRLSFLDSMTGLHNRRYFDTELVNTWKSHGRSQQPLSLIICDIDCFKQYNDKYGHPAGDECLIAVAQAMQNETRRPSDIAARIGGEEFGILLADTGAEGAVQVAENIRQAIARLAIEHAASRVKNIVTASFGVATMIPDQINRPESLVLLADEALYRSKHSGRDRIRAADKTSLPLAADSSADRTGNDEFSGLSPLRLAYVTK